MSPKVLMERSQEEMLREVEMRRQNQTLRAERKRPAASLRVSTVAWRLMGLSPNAFTRLEQAIEE